MTGEFDRLTMVRTFFMIKGTCEEAGVPPPAFSEDQGLLVMFRSSFTSPEHLRGLGLTERQIGIVNALREQASITNTDVQKQFGVSKRQATEDLAALEERQVVERKGTTGRGTRYVLKGAQGAGKGQERGRRGSRGIRDRSTTRVLETVVSVVFPGRDPENLISRNTAILTPASRSSRTS
jgi:hypothetical protein